ncbi:hypothetical protein ACOSQ2_025590 [Xanthoceras sorbifolium]
MRAELTFGKLTDSDRIKNEKRICNSFWVTGFCPMGLMFLSLGLGQINYQMLRKRELILQSGCGNHLSNRSRKSKRRLHPKPKKNMWARRMR